MNAATDQANPHRVQSFFKSSDLDLEGLSKHLDQLSNHQRVEETRSLGGSLLSRLYHAASERKAPLSLEHFVPAGTPEMREVVHQGRNSLLAFNYFQKRFCRPAHAKDQLWGYNEQLMKVFTGPGYFITRQVDESEVVIDYFETPPDKPAQWPVILSNSARLGRFVYHHMRDYMRAVSKHVSIGRAYREDKPMNAYFILCRDESL